MLLLLPMWGLLADSKLLALLSKNTKKHPSQEISITGDSKEF